MGAISQTEEWLFDEAGRANKGEVLRHLDSLCGMRNKTAATLLGGDYRRLILLAIRTEKPGKIPPLVKALISKGAPPSGAAGDYGTPLTDAIERSGITDTQRLALVKLLLDAGADPTFHRQDFATPLGLAVEHDRPATLTSVLITRATPAVLADGLVTALRKGEAKCVDALLAKLDDTSAVAPSGLTPAIAAALFATDVKTLEAVLKKAASPGLLKRTRVELEGVTIGLPAGTTPLGALELAVASLSARQLDVKRLQANAGRLKTAGAPPAAQGRYEPDPNAPKYKQQIDAMMLSLAQQHGGNPQVLASELDAIDLKGSGPLNYLISALELRALIVGGSSRLPGFLGQCLRGEQFLSPVFGGPPVLRIEGVERPEQLPRTAAKALPKDTQKLLKDAIVFGSDANGTLGVVRGKGDARFIYRFGGAGHELLAGTIEEFLSHETKALARPT